jgi:hypothetical protein
MHLSLQETFDRKTLADIEKTLTRRLFMGKFNLSEESLAAAVEEAWVRLG